jgi:hypothetical protein
MVATAHQFFGPKMDREMIAGPEQAQLSATRYIGGIDDYDRGGSACLVGVNRLGRVGIDALYMPSGTIYLVQKRSFMFGR